MFKVDAKAATKIPDLEKGWALVFVNCKECDYYMFFKPRDRRNTLKGFIV